jgi:hypothetical protein
MTLPVVLERKNLSWSEGKHVLEGGLASPSPPPRVFGHVHGHGHADEDEDGDEDEHEDEHGDGDEGRLATSGGFPPGLPEFLPPRPSATLCPDLSYGR